MERPPSKARRDGTNDTAWVQHRCPYRLIAFDRRNALRIRYRLLPEQPGWREGKNLDLGLGELRWGAHTLEVQARLFTGPWSGIQRKSFSVLKPYWLSWPFLFAFAGGTLTLATGGYQWRKKRAAPLKKTLPELAELRLAALSPEAHDVVGTVLDSRYEAGRILARGGFATVLKGRDLHRGGRLCAIKVFREELKNEAWTADQFREEVSAVERVSHPNVVTIYGHGATPAGLLYLVMEFIEGQTLRDLLDKGPLSPKSTAALLRQAGSALAEIHARGILHRDVTPENLMIRSDGAAGDLVLIDFSIAIVKRPDEALHGVSRAAGTFYYMAPEQVMGGGLPASDIYSLSKIVIEMLTGTRLSDLLPGATLDLSTRVRELLLTLPFPLSQSSIHSIASALEYDPYRRPQSIGAFVDPIAGDLESITIPTAPSANRAPFPSETGSGAASGR